MSVVKGLLKAGALCAAVLTATIPVAANEPELAMLDTLNRGGWDLRNRSTSGVQRICVRNGRDFIQLRHRQTGCEQYVIRDSPSEVTVQYTCRGNGYGRTTIRRESRDLVQIRSQGILGGTPFLIEGEARYAGEC